MRAHARYCRRMAKTTLRLPFSGGRLRAERERSGLLQEQLAQRCIDRGYAVSRARISSVERGEMPSAPLLKALADALGIKIDVLLDPEQDTAVDQ